MYAIPGRGEKSGSARRKKSGRPGADRPAVQKSTTPSKFTDVLSLQNLAGNAATAKAVAVQRASGSGSSSRHRRRRSDDDYDPDLAYGSDHGTPPPANVPFRGRVGGVTFASESNGAAMREIFNFVAAAAPYFGQELGAAGSITVQFGSTQGRTPGEWRAGSRSITLNPGRASMTHLAGTAIFEILNASAARHVAALEADVRSGRLDVLAEQVGWPPDAFFAREVEHIEWQNGMRHRQIVAAAGGSGTGADLFAAEGDFNAFYERQVRSNHTHSYEFRYNLLREEAASEARRRREAEEGGSSRRDSGHGSSSPDSHERHHRSHR